MIWSLLNKVKIMLINEGIEIIRKKRVAGSRL